MDLSPVNLHPFAQQGFDTTVGDARERSTLEQAGIASMRLAIVCVPNDDITTQVTAAIRAVKCEVGGRGSLPLRAEHGSRAEGGSGRGGERRGGSGTGDSGTRAWWRSVK